jgi:hypothetical protein
MHHLSRLPQIPPVTAHFNFEFKLIRARLWDLPPTFRLVLLTTLPRYLVLPFGVAFHSTWTLAWGPLSFRSSKKLDIRRNRLISDSRAWPVLVAMSTSTDLLQRGRVRSCTDEQVIGNINISSLQIGWVGYMQVLQWQDLGSVPPFPKPETLNSEFGDNDLGRVRCSQVVGRV